jgi:hypothetical protein
MANDDPSPPSLPADLQARLAAAGVTDDASLAAALQRDPALAADLQAFVEANAEALAVGGMAALLAAFAAVRDSEQMMAFWRSVPAGLEEPLMEAFEALIAYAEQAGDAATVAHLRPRLEGFRQIHEAAQQAAELPPVMRAVIGFVQAEDDATAEALFAQEKTLLQPYDAQQVMDALVAQAPPDTPAEVRERLAARNALLRRLRGAAPAAPPPSAPRTPLSAQTQVDGDLYQAGRDQYLFSAHAESGGVAAVVNNLFLSNLERRWLKPAPPALERDAVPRTAEMKAVLDALAERESVAITGQAAKAQALAVQGAPGVGKTTLAHLLALQLAEDGRYGDGVIWLELGPDFQSLDQAQAVLRAWAGYATGFFGLPDNLDKLFVFEPEAVRGLLAEHPRLLVVLDNVWSLAAIQPLRAALPAGAHLVVTTRLREIANGLAAGLVEVGLLSPAEALALFKLRLGWLPQEHAPDDAWAFDLAQAVGRHALGLDVALGVLRRYGDGAADWKTAARRLIAAVGSGEVERLHLGDDDPGHNVKAVIRFSYDALPDDETRRRLRALAAFAAETEFTTDLAAAAWGCSEEDAFETLTGFANAALLDRLGGGAWRQHGLLRAFFGLALLRDAGERDRAAAAHARAYGDAMRAADDEQRYYQMLPAMPQLRHAFEWALANDLELALDLAASCANLQQQFGLTREAGQWSERLLSAAQAGRAGPATLARAYGHRANILSELATLPGEDRRQRLYDALAAYDDALRFIRPDNAPLAYAQTQNNRANILSELATLPGEDRRQRLYDALAAYDDALRFIRPDNAPLDYAQTQNNRATILSALATLPGEDRRQRLYEALRCSVEAVTLFEQFQQVQYLEVGRRVMRSIRDACGADFAAMWAELGQGEPPDWLSQNPQAMAMDALLQAFVQVENAEQMVAFWQAVPTEMEEPLMAAVEALIAQAEQAGDAATVAHLRSRLEGFRQVRAAAAAARAIPEEARAEMTALAERAQAYVTRLQAADTEHPQVAEWQAVTALGEALLAEEGRGGQGLDWAALRRQLASDFNTLGNAHDSAGDPAAALAAFERAIALQPDFAMWRRNQAGALIALGRLEEAAAAIEQARALEPDASRLAQLEAQLAAAREMAEG